MEGSCDECRGGKEVWGEGVRGCAEGEKGGDGDLGKDSACCGAGAAATWKT